MPDSETLVPKLSAESLNDRLRNYEIKREIGHGAMGVVYEAQQSGLDRRVALKVLPPNLALRERTVKRFVREAEAMGRLAHPNVVDIFEVGSEESVHYFAMRYVEGPPLDRVLKAGPLAIADVVQIGIDVSDALAHAHGRGVMHRDIKPSNLLRDTDRVVLTDFGLARPLQAEEAGTMTESGDLVGTPLYMSPEQIGGDASAIDGRADVWGLGVTLYELLAQQPPFTGSNATSILNKILHKDPPLLRKLRDDVPRDLEAVVLKCLEKDPARRYSGAAALFEDLRSVRDGRPVAAAKPRFFDPVLRWMRRHPVQSGVAAIALATIGGLGIFWLGTSQDLADERELREAAEAQQARTEAGRQQALLEAMIYNARAELIDAQRHYRSARLAGELAEPGREDERNYAAQRGLALERIRALIDAFPIEEYPEIHAEAMTQLSSLMHEEGRGEEVLQAFLRTSPESEERGLQNLAAIYVGLNRPEDALAAHLRRMELDPANRRATFETARLYRELGELDQLRGDVAGGRQRLYQSIALCDRTRRLAVVAGDAALIAKVLAERGRAYLGLDRPDRARLDLEHSLQLDPSLAVAHAYLAQLDRVPEVVELEAEAPASPSPGRLFSVPTVSELTERLDPLSDVDVETLTTLPLPASLRAIAAGAAAAAELRESHLQLFDEMLDALTTEAEAGESESETGGAQAP